MLALQTQAKQHVNDGDSSANASPQSPQARFSLPQVADPAGEAVVPRQTLSHYNTGHPLVIPALLIIPTISVASTSVP